MRDIVRLKTERELVRIKINDGNAFWNEIGVNAGVSKLMLLSINLLLPVLVYAARHSLTAVRHKLMLPDITSYCWFWVTVKATTVNGERQIQALVDKKKVIITEKSVRSDLMLEDAEGIECLLNDVIFKQLTLMGYENLTQKVLDLEEAKTAQVKEIASLNKRVKQLEKKKKSRTLRLKRLRKVGSASRVESSNDTQEIYDEEMLFDIQDDLQGEEVVAEKEVVEKEVSVADPVTTAGEVVTTAGKVVTTASATTTVDELTLA
ncbi:hypothetical protein Tco_0826873 [Tanacetum coccineum]